MKYYFWIAALALLACACSVEEPFDAAGNDKYPATVYARIENDATASDTRAYVDAALKVLWENDDRISLFNKYTYNKEYRFIGETGANAGVFTDVNSGEIVTGNELDNVYAVYPYQESTAISNDGVITLNLPAVQTYKENSFGQGANTMVSATAGTELLFRNLCGYLILKLYGDNVSVSSITLQGNNGEPLAGTADVTMGIGSAPTLSFRSTGSSNTITLNCKIPVALGTTASEATVFWIVVPPTEFTTGLTLTITDPDGNSFVTKSLTSTDIVRNATYRVKALEVEMMQPLTNNVIYYTSNDGDIVTPNTTADFGANIVSNEYRSGQGLLCFDGEVTRIPGSAFRDCLSLVSITIPETVTTIQSYAFRNCTNLLSASIPNSVTIIGISAFEDCQSLSSIALPEKLYSIGEYAFNHCYSLESVIIPERVQYIDQCAFQKCTNLSTVFIGQRVSDIGHCAFFRCSSLTSIVITALSPPSLHYYDPIGLAVFNNTGDCPIYVPAESVEAYKSATNWSEYADRIQAIPR